MVTKGRHPVAGEAPMADVRPFWHPTRRKWEFVIDGAPDPSSGKRRQVRRGGFEGEEVAWAALHQLQAELRAQTYISPADENVRLAAYLRDEWLPAVRGSLEPSTLESYTRNIENHVIPRIGGVRLRDLAGSTLNRLYGDLRDNGGRRDGKSGGLSPRTVRYIHTIIRKALG